jgi:drug/metabolite transporter (DMT)-like permease
MLLFLVLANVLSVALFQVHVLCHAFDVVCNGLTVVLSSCLLQSSQIMLVHRLSGAHATVLNQLRNVFVFAVSLIVGWERFHLLEFAGLLCLILGNFFFNEVVRLPCKRLQRPPAALALNVDPSAESAESGSARDAAAVVVGSE